MDGSNSNKRVALVGLIAFAIAVPLLGIGLNPPDGADRLAGNAAVEAALGSPEVKQAAEAAGYDRTRVMPLDEHAARVSFYANSRVVLEVAVEPDGTVSASQLIPAGGVRAGARIIQTPIALLVLSALFLLMFATLPLRSLRNLDLLVVAGSTSTIFIVNQRLFELSIWLAIPLLTYLSLRCLRVGFVNATPAADQPKAIVDALFAKLEWNAVAALKVATGLAAVVAAMVCIPSGATGDVGIASTSGATELLRGNLPYGNIVDGIVHGDTYPILAYILYIPAAIFMPVRDLFDNLDGALWISTISLLVAAAAMYVAGRNADGPEFGLRNAFALLVFPPVLITASSGSNDLTTAMFVALAIASIAHAGRSTLALSFAAWAKVVPVLALPLWIASYREHGLRRALAAPAALTAVMLAVLSIYGGVDALLDMLDGIAFQSGRGSVLSPWTVIDAPALQLVVQAAAVAVAAAAAYAVWSSATLATDVRRICALAAGIMLAVQLAANYWSYAYLPWVYPLLAVALLWPKATTRLVGSDGDPAPSAARSDSGA